MFKQIKKKVRQFNRWMDYNPPGALTSTGWRLFKSEFKKKAPIRYWVTHDLYYSAIYPCIELYQEAYSWARYRLSRRYHVVDTGLKPGYHSNADIILYANFSKLCDYVEVTLGVLERMSDRNKSWAERYVPFYGIFKQPRDADAGIKHLQWAADLCNPSNPNHVIDSEYAKKSKSLLELYIWWTIERPSRKAAVVPILYSDQGLGLLSCLDPLFDRTAADYIAYTEACDKLEEQEEMWEKEDNDMLIRLIQLRHHF